MDLGRVAPVGWILLRLEAGVDAQQDGVARAALAVGGARHAGSQRLGRRRRVRAVDGDGRLFVVAAALRAFAFQEARTRGAQALAQAILSTFAGFTMVA